MISFRYHLVSIIGVFLAIALGVVIGTTALNGAVVGDLHHQVRDLKAAQSSDKATISSLQTAAGNADEIATAYGSKIVAGALNGVGVVVVGAPDATPELKDAVAREVAAAGGTVSAQVQLSKSLIDPARANDIQSLATSSARPIDLTLPSSTNPGTLAGAFLGFVLFGKGQATDLTQVLTGFRTLNMLTTAPNPAAGKLVVLVTSGTYSQGSTESQTLLALATELGQQYGPTVVAGDAAAASGAGVVASVRNDPTARTVLSTVDDLNTTTGQLTLALAGAEILGGHKGQYGTAAGVDALMPGTAN